MDTFSGVLQLLKAELNNVVYSLTVFLAKTYDHKTSLLFLSPVSTEVWSNTREAVTAEPSALRFGLQQICMFLTASELVFCSLFSLMNKSLYAFPVNSLELKEDDTTAEHPLHRFHRVYP